MALSTLAQNLIDTLQDIFGKFAGVRSSHAKGVFVTGSFTPTESAKELSTAPHFHHPTFVIARLSLFTGIPNLPSTDEKANPHGLAVRFVLDPASRLGTDIICHASKLFPGSDGEEVLAFFRSLRDGTVTEYASSHPAAAAFAQEHRPIPKSFAHNTFHSINAFKLINSEGKETFIRYRWVPLAGEDYLTEDELKAKSPNFLFEELPQILAKGPIGFTLVAQVAEQGDIADDCTRIWPEDRPLIELGTLKITEVMETNDADSWAAFNPIPGVEGVEASADPILAARSAVYSKSSKSRHESEL
ncbi:hypothetical protein CEP54_008094 [Fusarium duplospermum]|uniref:Catalase core domain-containing protein n=1 Tax=Fusarium duplospermum TaxID=1325734 RepID=A0A428PXK5_9HYPO|nr:hypothetical protein CEP54_008094 [Fusarium duplospermum]